MNARMLYFLFSDNRDDSYLYVMKDDTSDYTYRVPFTRVISNLNFSLQDYAIKAAKSYIDAEVVSVARPVAQWTAPEGISCVLVHAIVEHKDGGKTNLKYESETGEQVELVEYKDILKEGATGIYRYAIHLRDAIGVVYPPVEPVPNLLSVLRDNDIQFECTQCGTTRLKLDLDTHSYFWCLIETNPFTTRRTVLAHGMTFSHARALEEASNHMRAIKFMRED